MSGDEGIPTAQPQPSSPVGQQEGSAVLRLRGLPFVATEQDIRDFFRDYSLDEAYMCRRNGRSTGEAYVVLDPDAAQQALEKLNKQYMGRRYIELFQSSLQDLEAYKALASDARLRGHVVRLRGLPFSATAGDVVQFFDGIPLRGGEEGVVLTYTADGRPTGEAYVELLDEEGRKKAMGRHKELMGSRYIETFVSSKHDMLQWRWHGAGIVLAGAAAAAAATAAAVATTATAAAAAAAATAVAAAPAAAAAGSVGAAAALGVALQHSRLHLSQAAMRPSWSGGPGGAGAAPLMLLGGDPSGMVPPGGLMPQGQMPGAPLQGGAYGAYPPGGAESLADAFKGFTLGPHGMQQVPMQAMQAMVPAPPHRGGAPPSGFAGGPYYTLGPAGQGDVGVVGGGGGDAAAPSSAPFSGGMQGPPQGRLPPGGPGPSHGGLQQQQPRQPMMMQGGYMMMPAGSMWGAMAPMGMQPRMWYAPGGARPGAGWPEYAYESGGGGGGIGSERSGRHDPNDS